MSTKEKEYISAAISIRVVEHREIGKGAEQNPERNFENANSFGPLFEFAGSAPATFAERFPRLMVLAVSLAFILAAITAEIECLRGAGYYWP